MAGIDEESILGVRIMLGKVYEAWELYNFLAL